MWPDFLNGRPGLLLPDHLEKEIALLLILNVVPKLLYGCRREVLKKGMESVYI